MQREMQWECGYLFYDDRSLRTWTATGVEKTYTPDVTAQPCKGALDHPAPRKVWDETSFASPGRCQS
jgi:hypothetical protein